MPGPGAEFLIRLSFVVRGGVGKTVRGRVFAGRYGSYQEVDDEAKNWNRSTGEIPRWSFDEKPKWNHRREDFGRTGIFNSII
jgi:hypothetical protein